MIKRKGSQNKTPAEESKEKKGLHAEIDRFVGPIGAVGS